MSRKAFLKMGGELMDDEEIVGLFCELKTVAYILEQNAAAKHDITAFTKNGRDFHARLLVL